MNIEIKGNLNKIMVVFFLQLFPSVICIHVRSLYICVCVFVKVEDKKHLASINWTLGS